MSETSGPPSSFSGTHPFRPQCVINELLDTSRREGLGLSAASAQERAAEVIADVDTGRCPRCWDSVPTGNVRPAGSRVTGCRCIPVCGRCGEDEAVALHPVLDWPVDEEEIVTRRARRTLVPGFLVPSGDDGAVVVDDTGVTEVRPGPPTGGWSQFGYDDSEGQDERKR